jgi:uncharacterized protein (DUF302 family)
MKFLLPVLLSLCFVTHQALADDGLIRKQSKYSVEETLERVESKIKEIGGTVWVRIDLKAAAAKGETLRPHQLIIFGRGGALQPHLSRSSASGIDLPQKILVIEDADGTTWMVTNRAEYVAQRHGITDIASTIAGINKTVASVMDPVSQ